MVPVRLNRQPQSSLFGNEVQEWKRKDTPDLVPSSPGINTTAGLLARFDDVTVRALRALFATEEEWKSIGTLKNMENLNKPLSMETEESWLRCVLVCPN